MNCQTIQKETKESLIILLYCSMSIASSAALPAGSLDFALPQAVNLAEAGKKVHDKRIGYYDVLSVFKTEI